MANLNSFINIGGNAINGNTVSVSGNVTGNVIRVASGIVAFPIASPAPTLSGFGSINSVDITATGNITGGNVRTAGNITATGNVTATGNIAGGNVNTSGNVTGGNVNSTGGSSITGNISAGNVTAIGSSGMLRQGSTQVAIGASAGAVSQSSLSIAIGRLAGYSTQSAYSIAVGDSAGYFGQGGSGIAIGYRAGQTAQGSNSVAIGTFAGNTSLTTNSIAIGYLAANASSAGNIIVLNATGNVLNGTTANAFYVAPVRNDTVTAIGNVLVYNTTTREIAYSNTLSIAGSITSAGKFGYASGSTVTQTTNRGTSVTINALAGTIVTVSASIVAGFIDTFGVSNDQVNPNTDIVLAQIVSPNFGMYNVVAQPSAIINGFNNGFFINIQNISGGPSSNEAITIRFMVIKAPNA